MPLNSTCPSMGASAVQGTALRPAQQPRGVRVAASFCGSRLHALRLMALLSSHPGVHETQLALLSPADAAPERFDLCRQRWDCLRPRPVAQDLQHTPVPLAIAGALLGALAGLALSTGLSALGDVITVPLLGALAGWLIAMQAQQRSSSAGRYAQFDQRLQRRLADGLHAVVLVDVGDQRTAAQVLDAMRQAGVCWCAEVPPLRHV